MTPIPVQACFLGALQFVARKSGNKDAAANAKIHSSVALGRAAEMGGFGLKVDLKIEGVDDANLIQAAHEVRRLQYRSHVIHYNPSLHSSALTAEH
jgi:organic hydroperoxide reductase OsmC/OhrA